MIYVTSDLHGYPLADFQKLLRGADFSDEDELIILGDVIDRGEESVALLMWALGTKNVRMLLGNHEDMMLQCRFAYMPPFREGNAYEEVQLNRWMRNGGGVTLEGLQKMARWSAEATEEIVEKVQALKLYEVVYAGEQRFLLCHAGLGHYSPLRQMGEYTKEDLIWYRPGLHDRWDESTTVIFGHTPTGYYGEEYQGRMLRGNGWIDIDTGAAMGGHPMLLRLNDLVPFYVD
ncbi:MAG: metallophosphoesterase [Clostridia bacterium]|nr:metallophosphoesterase [Clostridia bacterium]